MGLKCSPDFVQELMENVYRDLAEPEVYVGLNRQKHLPRPTTDRRRGIARIRRRAKVPRTEVRSKQKSREVRDALTFN